MCLAVPGRIVDRHERGGTAMATVDLGGRAREVCLELVPEARPGDWVVVHLGMALDVIDEREARETLATAEQLTTR